MIRNYIIAVLALAAAALSLPASGAEYPGDLHSLVFPLPPFEYSAQQTEDQHIPMVLNDRVEAYIDHYTTEKTTFQAALDNSVPYLHIMKAIFRDENLPEELVYVAMIESSFMPGAVSRSSAVGLWQFMSGTAREYGLRNDRWVDERRDNIKATFAAARYFRYLYSRLRSWNLVLAAYNAGIGKVLGAVFGTGSDDFWDLAQSRYLARETKMFVPKFMAAAIIARDPSAYGFRVPAARPLRFDVMEVKRSTDLRTLARAVDSSYAVLKSLNPQINGRFTPPGQYLLRIPAGTGKTLAKDRIAAGRIIFASAGSAAGSPALLTASRVSAPGSRRDRPENPYSSRNRMPVLVVRNAKPRKSRAAGKIPLPGPVMKNAFRVEPLVPEPEALLQRDLPELLTRTY